MREIGEPCLQSSPLSLSAEEDVMGVCVANVFVCMVSVFSWEWRSE